MSFIEGVGDEVTQFFITLILVVIGLLAWWTTRVTENAPFRTVYLLEQQLRVFTQSPTTYTDNLSTESQTASSTDQSVQSSTANASAMNINEENKPPEPSGSVESNPEGGGENSSVQEEEQSAIVRTMDSNDSSDLRNRRIAFFHLRNNTLIEETTNTASSSTATNVSEMQEDENFSEDQTERINTIDNIENLISDVSVLENQVENCITIKLKYINDDLKTVTGRLHEQLGDFKRRHFELELQANKLVRLIFNGHVLQRDQETLQSYGMFDNCVVHCLVHQRRTTAAEAAASAVERDVSENYDNNINSQRLAGGLQMGNGGAQGRDCDLGNLLFALASFILGVAWYFRYEYAQLYTVTTTIALVGLTGVFTVLFVGMYFPDPDPPPPRTA